MCTIPFALQGLEGQQGSGFRLHGCGLRQPGDFISLSLQGSANSLVFLQLLFRRVWECLIVVLGSGGNQEQVHWSSVGDVW